MEETYPRGCCGYLTALVKRQSCKTCSTPHNTCSAPTCNTSQFTQFSPWSSNLINKQLFLNVVHLNTRLQEHLNDVARSPNPNPEISIYTVFQDKVPHLYCAAKKENASQVVMFM